MPNYNESTVVGTRYRRTLRVVGENPLGGTPSLTFVEEEVVVLPDDTITRPVGMVQTDLTEPLTEFNLLSPVDDSVIGTSTYQDVYLRLYGLYRHLAALRDAQP